MNLKIGSALSYSIILLCVSVISFLTSFFSILLLKDEVFRNFILFILASNFMASISSFCIHNAVMRVGISFVANYRLILIFFGWNFLILLAGGMYFWIVHDNVDIFLCSFFYSFFYSLCIVLSSHYQNVKSFYLFSTFSLLPNLVRFLMLFHLAYSSSFSYSLYALTFFMLAAFAVYSLFTFIKQNLDNGTVSVDAHSGIMGSLHWQVFSTFLIMGFTVFPQLIVIDYLSVEQVKAVSSFFLVVGVVVLFPNILFGRVYFKRINEEEFSSLLFGRRIFLYSIFFFISLIFLYLLFNLTCKYFYCHYEVSASLMALLPFAVYLKVFLVPVQMACMRESVVKYKFRSELISMFFLMVLLFISKPYGLYGVLGSIIIADLVLFFLLLRRLYVR